MSEKLTEKESFLNFSYLSAIFYDYVVNSGRIFKKINLAENDNRFEKTFDDLNYENFSKYLEYSYYLDHSKEDEDIKQKKIKIIKSIFNLDFKANEKVNILSKICDKMTLSIFHNKNKLVKLLSQQIINFIFDIR